MPLDLSELCPVIPGQVLMSLIVIGINFVHFTRENAVALFNRQVRSVRFGEEGGQLKSRIDSLTQHAFKCCNFLHQSSKWKVNIFFILSLKAKS